MSGAAVAKLLPDGRRLHLQHGPIDIVAEAFGDSEEVRRAYHQAARRFSIILEELVELACLWQPVGREMPPVEGSVARDMAAAVFPHRDDFRHTDGGGGRRRR